MTRQMTGTNPSVSTLLFNINRFQPALSPVICCGTKYADAHSREGIIPDWVPTFDVSLDPLNWFIMVG